MSRTDLAIFEKLVRIHALSPSYLDHILKVARRKTGYQEEMEKLEARCKAAQKEDDSEERCLAGSRGKCDYSHQSLQAAFLADPWLSQVSPQCTSIFAAFADLRPGLGGFPESRDAVFVRIAHIMADEGGVIDFQQILKDNFVKLIGLDRVCPSLLDPLVELARTPNYSGDLSVIDTYLDKQAAGKKVDVPELSTFGKQVLDALGTELVFSEGIARKPWQPSEIRQLLLSSPRLSYLPAGQIFAYYDIRQELLEKEKRARSLIKSEDYRWRAAAFSALDLMEAGKREELELTVRLRCDVAREYLERRKYAKMQALDEGWPELSKRVGIDGLDALRSLEKAILRPEEMRGRDPSGVPGWWKPFRDDERFRRFLEIQPFFQMMSDQELGDFFAVSKDHSRTARAPEAEGPSGGSNAVFAHEPFSDLFVALELRQDKVFVQIFSKTAGDKGPETPANIPLQEVHQLEHQVREMYLRVERPVQQARPTRDVVFPQEPQDVLRSLGERLFDGICGDGKIRKILSEGLEESGQRVRLVIKSDHPNLSDLSWESLYFEDMRIFLASTLRFSLVRYVSGMRDLVFRSLEPPLRILAVLVSPESAPLAAAEKEGKVLRQTLAHAEEEGHVLLRIVSNVDKEELRSELRRFHPHVLHFVGHGLIHNGVGHLLLDGEGEEGYLSASDFGKTLQDTNVSLAILNACETGIAGGGEVINGVAQAIVREGVPAAVATTRVILDSAALMFSREFYRALVDGYPLESALVEARRVLDLKSWDWSAYALFTGSTDLLDDLRLLRYRGGGSHGEVSSEEET